MRKWIKKAEEWCNRHEWVIFLLLLLLILRLPSLFTPHYYGDEEIYFVMGRAWREGVPLYQAMFDHKPPMIYVLAGIFNTVYLFRLSLFISMAIHTILFWKLAAKFWGRKYRKLAYLSSFLFVFVTSWPTLEGNIANAELFMMLPVTASLLIVWGARKGEWKKYLIGGLVAGIGWLYKVPVLFDVVGIALYLFAFREKSFKKSFRGFFSLEMVNYLGGFALPLIMTFVYYYLKGHGASYLDTVLTMNLSYVSSWETGGWAFNPLESGLVRRGLVLFGFTLFLYLIRKKLDKRLLLSSLWLGFSFFGSLLSARPYPHYLLQPVVPLMLWLPQIVVIKRFWGWLVIGYLAIWGVFTQKEIGFWGYESLPFYSNFYKLVSKQISKEEYMQTFDGVRRNYAIADYLNERMDPEDKLYIWGSDAAVYNLTRKLPAGGKYIVNFHVHDLQKHDYVMSELMINQPLYIVVLPGTTEFPQLDELLEREYLETADFEKAKIYRRVSEVLGSQKELE